MAKFNQIPLRESDRIEVELRRLILTLELEPGLAISEASLMKQYRAISPANHSPSWCGGHPTQCL